MVIANTKEFDRLALELGICTYPKMDKDKNEPCKYSVLTVNRDGIVKVYQTTRYATYIKILRLCSAVHLTFIVYRLPLKRGGAEFVHEFRKFTIDVNGKRLASYF